MTKAKGQGSVLQGVVVLLVFLLCSGGIGFAVGYTQQFAPVQKVAPGTAGATAASSGGTGSAGSAVSSSSEPTRVMKKAYWIGTRGYERAGYSIKVFLNDQEVGTFQTPERLVDVTRYVHPGDNKVRFVAKALPAGNRCEYTGAYLDVFICQGEKFSSNGYKNGEKLVEYRRSISETEDFDTSQDFSIIE